ncbi:MAG: hypothetical protein R2941_24760 [Desulfobacterales bacterium]
MSNLSNPKSHDALFKWLVTAFTQEFFAHYFPEIRIGKYRFADKEFISRYEALKESLKGDLFLMMEVEMDDGLQEVFIQIEHKSRREEVAERVHEYACYAWLLKKKPVWSMVIYTDDAIWQKPVRDSFCYAFDSTHRKQYHYFDVIKVKAEKSRELMHKNSLLCKLLALKADDRDADPEQLVYEIYRAGAERMEHLDNDQLLLLEQWVSFYKKVSDQQAEKIKKEVNMESVATTISEHIFHQGIIKGMEEGRAEGRAEGRKKTALNLVRMGVDIKIISQATGLSEEEIKQISSADAISLS